MEDTASPPPFSCPHCGAASDSFQSVCPVCGRLYFRDYIDVRMHPRDSNLTGTFSYRQFRARVFLVLAVLVLSLVILMMLIG